MAFHFSEQNTESYASGIDNNQESAWINLSDFYPINFSYNNDIYLFDGLRNEFNISTNDSTNT
ncbi:hypothetical protein Bhyg_16316, partial [Pseudolycoriella hygida]